MDVPDFLLRYCIGEYWNRQRALLEKLVFPVVALYLEMCQHFRVVYHQIEFDVLSDKFHQAQLYTGKGLLAAQLPYPVEMIGHDDKGIQPDGLLFDQKLE